MATMFAIAPQIPKFLIRREAVAASIVATAIVCLALRFIPPASPSDQVERGWVGALTAQSTVDGQTLQPLSSSSLVVPNADLALPAVEKTRVRAQPACDSADKTCTVKPLPGAAAFKRVPAPVDGQARRSPQVVAPELHKPVAPASAKRKEFSFNPLDHVPDAATLGRPFTAAGSFVAGWVKRF